MQQLTDQQQQAMLAAYQDIPPELWLSECNTEDRKASWRRWKFFYSSVRRCLIAHFSGDELPSDLPHELRQMCGFHMDFHLALYGVISWGWKYIKEDCPVEIENFPNRPGEMLNIILSDEALGALISTAFPEELTGGNYFYQFSPRKIYNFYREWSEVDKLISSDEELKKPQKMKIEKHLKAREALKRETEKFFHFLGLCIYICERRKQSDKVLRHRLETFKQAHQRLRAEIKGLAHQRKTPRGYVINKGIRTLNISSHS